MATVFVTQDSGNINLTPALKFGNIEILADRDIPLFRNPKSAVIKIVKNLETYNPDEDYILMAGDPLNIAATISHVMDKFGECRCLKWDRQNRQYLPIILPRVGW